ncbi:MAG: putative sugar O-methyltransferase [Nitrososphaera sp.]|nr:putative sugar O-methyltransferase [Nitrososphaera sp.]
MKLLDTGGFLEREEEPSVGGAEDQELINKHAVSLDFLQSVEETYFLKKAWAMAEQPGSPRLILDLGAGYGRLAYVCRRMIPDCTYVILDLPEGLACSSSWLCRTLPGEVVPYSKSRRCARLSRETLLREKVWTLATRQIEAIEDLSIDAFVNIYSFAEMPKEAICNYFTHLDRITKGIFYTKQRMLEQNTLDGVCIGMEDYPVRRHWRLLSSNISTLYDSFFECAYSVNAR